MRQKIGGDPVDEAATRECLTWCHHMERTLHVWSSTSFAKTPFGLFQHLLTQRVMPKLLSLSRLRLLSQVLVADDPASSAVWGNPMGTGFSTSSLFLLCLFRIRAQPGRTEPRTLQLGVHQFFSVGFVSPVLVPCAIFEPRSVAWEWPAMLPGPLADTHVHSNILDKEYHCFTPRIHRVSGARLRHDGRCLLRF